MAHRLRWLTNLSLDAPLVAVAWQLLLARSFEQPLEWYHSVLTFLPVWLGYSADRWLDTRQSSTSTSPRHLFYNRNSRGVLSIWILTLLSSLTLAWLKLTSAELARGFALTGLSLAYTLFAQQGRAFRLYPQAKALFTATLVLASSLVFLAPSDYPSVQVFGVWSLFASNCLLIRTWTRPSEVGNYVAAGIAAAACLLSTVFLFKLQDYPMAASLIASLCLLGILDRWNPIHFGELRRTLADLALLTAFAALFF